MQPRRTLPCYSALERALPKQNQMDIFIGLIEPNLSNGSDQIQNPFLNDEPSAKADEKSIRRQVETLSNPSAGATDPLPQFAVIAAAEFDDLRNCSTAPRLSAMATIYSYKGIKAI